MNLKLLSLAVICLVSLASGSCKKETSDDLQKRADEFKAYLIGKHFIPVDFYADIPIDYDETDGDNTPSKDLKDYILFYLWDDEIEFMADGKLQINQGRDTFPVVTGGPEFPLNPIWSIQTKKATNEVLFNYLEYTYQPQKYILDHFTEDEILAHIIWTGGGQTARLYTKFQRK